MLNGENKLEVGVVGLGKMGLMHACLLNTFQNVEVKALCDKSRLMRTLAKHAFPKATVTGNLAEFAPLNLDALYVLTPIPSHYEIIKQIYSSNLAGNVFTEKTLSQTYSKSQELSRLATKYGGANMVGYMKRFGVTFNHLKSLLEQGMLGELESFESYAFSSDFAEADEGSEASKARGGVVEDLGSHVTDLALWLFGDLTVTAAEVNSQISIDSEDDVSFQVEGINGFRGRFEVSWRKADYRMPEFGIKIQGSSGSVYANDDEVKLTLPNVETKTWYRHDLNDNVGFYLGGSEYYRENQNFLQAVESGLPVKSSFESAAQVDFLLEQVRRKLH